MLTSGPFKMLEMLSQRMATGLAAQTGSGDDGGAVRGVVGVDPLQAPHVVAPAVQDGHSRQAAGRAEKVRHRGGDLL
ncbi:hypothetical protein GCM10023075_68400 [Streptosporangium album]